MALALSAVVGCVSGCGGADKSGTSTQMTGADMSTPPVVGMLCTDARADNWQLPIAKTSESGAYKVTLMSSAAAIPVIGDSTTTWTIAVADATTGAAVSGATISVLPWMPDHGHGTSVHAVVTEVAGAPGQYALEPLYFFMAGYWTVTLTIDSASTAGATDGGASDKVVFSLCLTDAT
ncbi:MAG TPA: FixH family protein [Polyangia bacterium]|nr:FixH family protein [Polyangia bacterium]